MAAPSGLRCHGGGPEPLCRSGELQARSGAIGIADFSATHVKESSNLPKLYNDSSFQILSYVRLPERLIWSPKVAVFAPYPPRECGRICRLQPRPECGSTATLT